MASKRRQTTSPPARLRVVAVQMKFAPTIKGNLAAQFLAANWKQMVRAAGKQAAQARRAFAVPKPPAGFPAKTRRKGGDR